MIGDLGARDATELAGLVAAGEVTPTELLDAALAAVEARNGAINAVVLMQEGVARKAIAAGLPPGPFRGVPFLIKDLGCEAVDFPSHNGSRLFANTVYRRDSAIFERIRATGVVTFGRTTSPEGGIGAATEAAVYGGPTRNPWNGTTPRAGPRAGRGRRWRRGSWPLPTGRTGAGRCASRQAPAGFSGSSPRGRGCRMGPMRARAGRAWRSTGSSRGRCATRR